MDPSVFSSPEELGSIGLITDKTTESERLFYYGATSVRNDPHFMEFQLLQRLNITNIQNDLAKCKLAIVATSQASQDQMVEVKTLLKDYGTDLQYMQTLSRISHDDSERRRNDLIYFFPSIGNREEDPYYTSYRRLPRIYGNHNEPELDWVRSTLRDRLPKGLSYSKEEKLLRSDEFHDGKTPEGISAFVDGVARFVIAFAGGASLLIPMMIMVFHPSLAKSLVTVSVATTLFAVLSSVAIKTKNSETLAATAGYAAVLVVFIGTNGTTS